MSLNKRTAKQPKMMDRNENKSNLIELMAIAVFFVLLSISEYIILNVFISSSGIKAYESAGLDGILISASVTLFGISIAVYAFLTSGINTSKEWVISALRERSRIGDTMEKCETGRISDEVRTKLQNVFKLISCLFFTAVACLFVSIYLGIWIEVIHSSSLLIVSPPIIAQIAAFFASLDLLLAVIFAGYRNFQIALES